MAGVITNVGRILLARLLKGEEGQTGLTHMAVGDGDETFTDPLGPPEPDVDQTALKHELARKVATRSAYLIPVEDGTSADVIVDGLLFDETLLPTNTVAFFFCLEEDEANGITIKEYGLFGGDVIYRSGVSGGLAENGVYDENDNPTGEVEEPGTLFQVKNIPDFHKTEDARFELVGVIALGDCTSGEFIL
jgi:hypothetical protein